MNGRELPRKACRRKEWKGRPLVPQNVPKRPLEPFIQRCYVNRRADAESRLASAELHGYLKVNGGWKHSGHSVLTSPRAWIPCKWSWHLPKGSKIKPHLTHNTP